MTNIEHVNALKEELATRGLDGFVIPLTDEHMSEYVGAYARRLAWLTGFTGSAGSAALLAEKGAIFTDVRYTVQTRAEVDAKIFAYKDVPATSVIDWLEEQAQEGQKIGYDPWLHTITWVEEARRRLADRGAELVAVEHNPIDAVWQDQPARPDAAAVPQPIEYAGKAHTEKLKDIAKVIIEKRAAACVLAALDSIAWAFNIRGRDIAHTPVALAFAIINEEGHADLFLDAEKQSEGLAKHLGETVNLRPRKEFLEALDQLGRQEARVLCDPGTVCAAIFERLQTAGAKPIKLRDPAILAKACKNQVEIAGARAAHERDGAALSTFLAWFAQAAPKGELDEIAVAEKLTLLRARCNHFQDLSFRTISAAGRHAALPHYSVSEKSNIAIEPNSVFLVDSGGQYLDGTTDVTRTIAVGQVSDEARQRFTLVLKGHIALAVARFPQGTPGRALDTLARMPLWQAGLDFDHGTGHGVGSYLSVHEGPQRIAKAGSDEPLLEGMILSNEPGYYKVDGYGIRIENLVLVTKMPQLHDELPMLGFETLTLAPIDLAMIKTEMLKDHEKAWLNEYHVRVREVITPLVDDETAKWLTEATREI